MAQLNLSLPSFAGIDLSDEKQLRKLTSYLYKLDEQLRYVLANLGEENLSDSLRTVINTKSDATVLGELTGQLQRLSTQIVQTAEAIALKAGKEELDALGEVLSESVAEFEVTADQIRSEVSSTASGLQSQIDQQAGEISLRVTGDQLAAGLDGKLDADAPSVGVNTKSGIVINEDGVFVEGRTIDLRTSDGDEYVNINEVGVSASSISAPNVMPRYDKWEYIAVSHDETQLSYNNVFRSLQDALNYLNGRAVDTPVYLGLAFSDNDYGDALLQGAVFLKNLTIGANSGFTPTIAGTLRIEGCSGNIFINGVNFNPANGANGITAYGESYVEVTDGVFTGNGNGFGIIKTRGGSLYVENCEFYNFLRSVVARASAHATMIECKGNCKINADRGGIINTCGYMPDSESSFNPEQSWGGKVFTDNTYVDQGSGGSTSAPTTTYTAAFELTASDTFGGDSGWNYGEGLGSDRAHELFIGYMKGEGKLRGFMWFDNNAIRSTLAGKTILSATLSLTAYNGPVGQGQAVSVKLGSTTVTADNHANVSSPQTYVNNVAFGSAQPKTTTTAAIDTGLIGNLVNGSINGIVLYSDDSEPVDGKTWSRNYHRFYGQDDSRKPVLTITYQG